MSSIAGLEELLHRAQLTALLPQATAFCEEWGAADVREILGDTDLCIGFQERLQLKKLSLRRFEVAASDLSATPPEVATVPAARPPAPISARNALSRGFAGRPLAAIDAQAVAPASRPPAPASARIALSAGFAGRPTVIGEAQAPSEDRTIKSVGSRTSKCAGRGGRVTEGPAQTVMNPFYEVEETSVVGRAHYFDCSGPEAHRTQRGGREAEDTRASSQSSTNPYFVSDVQRGGVAVSGRGQNLDTLDAGSADARHNKNARAQRGGSSGSGGYAPAETISVAGTKHTGSFGHYFDVQPDDSEMPVLGRSHRGSSGGTGGRGGGGLSTSSRTAAPVENNADCDSVSGHYFAKAGNDKRGALSQKEFHRSSANSSVRDGGTGSGARTHAPSACGPSPRRPDQDALEARPRALHEPPKPSVLETLADKKRQEEEARTLKREAARQRRRQQDAQQVSDVSQVEEGESSMCRIDPDDGRALCFDELRQRYAQIYSPAEIFEYWENECTPVLAAEKSCGSRAGGGVGGRHSSGGGIGSDRQNWTESQGCIGSNGCGGGSRGSHYAGGGSDHRSHERVPERCEDQFDESQPSLPEELREGVWCTEEEGQRRVDPDDGRVYEYDEICRKYVGRFRENEIQAYWREECFVRGQ